MVPAQASLELGVCSEQVDLGLSRLCGLVPINALVYYSGTGAASVSEINGT